MGANQGFGKSPVWVKTTVLMTLAAFVGECVPASFAGKRLRSPRVLHAQEVLGLALYSQSALPASEAWGPRKVSLAVIDLLKKRLPQRDRTRARRIAQALLTESARYGFDPFLVLAMIETESRFNPRTVGSVGEIGLLQIRPTTAAWIAKRTGRYFGGTQTLFNPAENIRLGLAYVAYLREQFQARSRLYLSAYNMGGLAVRRLLSQSRYPVEYPSRVVGNYLKIYRDLAGHRDASAVLAAN